MIARNVLSVFLSALVACAAVAVPNDKRTARIDRPTSSPYQGDLSIFEGADREEKMQVQRVMDVLGIKAGSNVADVGAGSGWFTVRSARRVGAGGIVYAVDINPDAIRYIRKRAKKEKLANVRPILSKPDDPRLPKQSVDAVLLLKTYHEIAQPIALLGRLKTAMRPGALLGIIDKKGTGGDHGLDSDVVVREAKQAGFTLAAKHDFVKEEGVDYFLVFQAR